MKQLSVGDKAPDFNLPDHQGDIYQFSDIYLDDFVLLVFNIGFA